MLSDKEYSDLTEKLIQERKARESKIETYSVKHSKLVKDNNTRVVSTKVIFGTAFLLGLFVGMIFIVVIACLAV